jgi:hypothetical protein
LIYGSFAAGSSSAAHRREEADVVGEFARC